MKLLIVSLTLTIFTGSQAFVLRDESNSKLSELERELREYSENSVDALFKKMSLVGQSGIGKTLTNLPLKIADQVHRRLNALQSTLPAEAIEVNRQLSSAYWDLERKVTNDLHAIRNKVAPEHEAFVQALKSDTDPVLRKLDHYLKPFRHKFVNTFRELNAKLDEMLKQQVEKMKEQSKKFEIWVEKVQNSLNSFADQVQEKIMKEVEKAHHVLQPPAARVLEVLKKNRESFDRWVHSHLFS